MKLTKKILAILASAIMMTGSVSSVSAASDRPDVLPMETKSIYFWDHEFIDEDIEIPMEVKAKDGTVLSEGVFAFEDGWFENELSMTSTNADVYSWERYNIRMTMMQYQFKGKDDTKYTFRPFMTDYDSNKRHHLVDTMPNGAEGYGIGYIHVIDYKKAG